MGVSMQGITPITLAHFLLAHLDTVVQKKLDTSYSYTSASTDVSRKGNISLFGITD